jgi:hypothetical protein
MKLSKSATFFASAIVTTLLAAQAMAAPPYKPIITTLAGHAYGSLTDTQTPYPETPGFIVGSYEGMGNASGIGRFTFTATHAFRWDAATPNGSGGWCAPSSGSATLSGMDGSELYLDFTGPFCETGFAASTVGTTTSIDPLHLPAPPFAFTGTFVVTGGTGRFSAKSGGVGSMVGTSDADDNVFIKVDGKFLK